MKIFISQPMKGKTESEIITKRMICAINFLRRDDNPEIINSYFEDYNPEIGSVPLKYLAKSLELLADADEAWFAKGWESNKGCRIEFEAAVAYGIKVMFE